ncbi:MAG: chromosome condensation protein, partial [Planctomycetota bacterium]
QSRGQVMNDMLVEKLIETILDWNQKHKSFGLARHACVMLPLNLREIADHELSACNVVGQSFIRRSASDLKDRQKFRQELGNELLQIKHSRHKIRFMHMIAGAHYFYPKILKTSLNIKRGLATAILSNTGDPTRQFYNDLPRKSGLVQCGNLVLEDVAGVPPLRPGTNATLSVFTYRRELKICVRCNSKQFSDQETRMFLNCFVERLRTED